MIDIALSAELVLKVTCVCVRMCVFACGNDSFDRRQFNSPHFLWAIATCFLCVTRSCKLNTKTTVSKWEFHLRSVFQTIKTTKMHGPAVFIDLTLEDQVSYCIEIAFTLQYNVEYNLKFIIAESISTIFANLSYFVLTFRHKSCEDSSKVWAPKSQRRNPTKESKTIYTKSSGFVTFASKTAMQVTSMAYWTASFPSWFR